MKKEIIFILFIILIDIKVIAQTLIYSTDSEKHCKINITKTEVKNNLFEVIINVTWVQSNLNPLTDASSVIAFERDKITCNYPNFVKLVSKEKDQKIITINNKLNLQYEINEEFQGGEIKLNYPFFYSINSQSALKPETRQEFTFKRPRDYNLSFTMDKRSIIDKTLPYLFILSPEGVESGLKPVIEANSVRVVLAASDFFGIQKILVNNTEATWRSDSTYFADIPLKVGYESNIYITATDSSGLVSKKQFPIEARKPVEMIANTAPALVQPVSERRQPSDVDIDIPVVAIPNSNKYALIIGNEDYSSFQNTLQVESNVEFAIHDAQIFKEYAIKMLGVPEENIILVLNAKLLEMNRSINQINSIAKNLKGQAELIVFYAGHGFPDEQTKESYLIPVDVSGSDLQYAIKLNEFYRKLSEFPSKRVTVFLDACFSGGGRNMGLVAARGVKIRPKENVLKGNLVVFAASSGEQSSLPYRDKQHGMFTYYLFKKLKETNGDISYEDLAEYLSSTVSIRSVMVNNKEQNPQTNVSTELYDKWKTWMIK